VQHLAVRTDEHDRVVQSATAELRIALVDPDRNRQLVAPRGRLNRFQMTGLQVDRVVQQPAVDLLRQLGVVAGTKSPQPFRVAGQPRLWKRDKPSSTRRGLLQEL